MAELMRAHDIGWAVGELRSGRKVCRAGWNGKGMFLWLTDYHRSYHRSFPDDLPYVTMKTVDNKCVPWTCSQTDLLATDWEVVEEWDL